MKKIIDLNADKTKKYTGYIRYITTGQNIFFYSNDIIAVMCETKEESEKYFIKRKDTF